MKTGAVNQRRTKAAGWSAILLVGLLCCALVPLAIACFSSARAPTAPIPKTSVLGCYEVTLGEWTPKLDAESAEYMSPPDRMKLADFDEVEPLPGRVSKPHAWGHWHVEDGTVRVSWALGFSGMHMTLTPEGSNLSGQAETTWDCCGADSQTAPAVARRIPCPG